MYNFVLQKSFYENSYNWKEEFPIACLEDHLSHYKQWVVHAPNLKIRHVEVLPPQMQLS